MKQKRFSVEHIVAVLKQAEPGVPLAELIRRVGISEQTFYRWKKQDVGLEVAYGIVLNPNPAEVESLQTMGNEDLAEPDTNPFIKLWFYTYRPLENRIRLAAAYHAWSKRKPLELLPWRQ